MPVIRTVSALSKQPLSVTPTPLTIDIPTDEEVEAAHSNAAKLQALANAAQNLNELSDRLNAQVAEIEGAINKLNLGVRASVEAEVVSIDESASRCVFFEYEKVAGKWGFVINQYIDVDPENTYEQWAFKDAPRDLRLKVVERIPLLLDELVTKSISLASDITDKITVAKGLISSFPQSSPAGPKR